MTTEQLDELERLALACQAEAPGEWFRYDTNPDRWATIRMPKAPEVWRGVEVTGPVLPTVATYIVAAQPAVVLALIEQMRRLQEESPARPRD